MAIPVGKAPHKKPFVFSRPGSEISKSVQTPHSAAADEAKHQGEKYNVYLKDKEYLTQIYQKFGIDKEPTAKDVQTWRDAMQNFSETHGHNIGDTIPAKSWANSLLSIYINNIIYIRILLYTFFKLLYTIFRKISRNTY